jgi:xylan 1,4-beta-xylosidase
MAVATRNDGEVDVLMWNYHDANVAAPDADVHLSVDGLTGKVVEAEEYRMDANHSNAYKIWQDMGRAERPTAEELARLKSAGKLERTQDLRMRVRGGKAEMNVKLGRQAVVLLRLRER